MTLPPLMVGKAHTGNLSESGVRLLRGYCHNPCADSSLLRTALESRRLCLRLRGFPALSDKLINSRHLTIHSLNLIRSPHSRGIYAAQAAHLFRTMVSMRTARRSPGGRQQAPYSSNELSSISAGSPTVFISPSSSASKSSA